MKRLLLIAPLLLLALGLAWRQHTLQEMRRALAEQRAQHARQQALWEENQQLRAAEPSPEERRRRHEDRATLAQLRRELAELQAAAAAAPPVAPRPEVPPPTPRIAQAMLAVSEWQNAGWTTPLAAVETTLWAGAGGDLETLETALWFSPEARTQAQTLFDQLAPKQQAEYGTPERLIALLTARDIPLGAARLHPMSPSQETHYVMAQIQPPEGPIKFVRLTLKPEGNRWRIAVPRQALERYAAALLSERAPAPAP